ncbi:hypothetical protein GGS23DRAFT_598442 [Durotheca rogersii]|uniref:uncharacterized protein n=1 Tax=Durotheca rogersii TaxID=419775 RepID=UPI0022201909|nr:uncharacterized protein GGS23DRAFT_598442 [Durotheca rogersii]KAI5861669.1 hypothetical protein GGS23DRAFT_598442 [Durotheca rogersii]
MLSQNTIALLGLASTAAAALNPRGVRSLRDLRAEPYVVEVRQAEDSPLSLLAGQGECVSSYFSLATSVPQPPDDLLSFLEAEAYTIEPTDTAALCALTSALPASLSSAVSSYERAGSSWLSQHSSEVFDLASRCADDQAASSISDAFDLALQTLDPCGSSTPATPTGAAENNNNDAAPANSVSTGGVAHPTGVIAGAMAAAGLLGAAIMLGYDLIKLI